MAPRGYEYQYDTNPRKLKPEYTKKKKTTSKTTKKQLPKKTQENKKSQKTKKQEQKAKKRRIAMTKLSVFFKCTVLFTIAFLVLFRNSQISESFQNIQKLKNKISTIQKENDQIEINIQNSMNTNNLEQNAKVLLGMQKLTNKQIVYINIPKKDYVEYKVEEVIMEEEKGFFEELLETIRNLF